MLIEHYVLFKIMWRDINREKMISRIIITGDNNTKDYTQTVNNSIHTSRNTTKKQ